VRKQAWKIVLRYLLEEAVCWSDEHIGEEAWLFGADVGKPATHD
jgi:hypothetical protein